MNITEAREQLEKMMGQWWVLPWSSKFRRTIGFIEGYENKDKEKTNVKLTKEEVSQILKGEVIKGRKVNVGMVQ